MKETSSNPLIYVAGGLIGALAVFALVVLFKYVWHDPERFKKLIVCASF